MKQDRTEKDGDRAQVQLVDVLLGAIVLVSILVTAPFYYNFIGMVSNEAGPFTSLLLQLVVPALFIGLVLSMGVSARRAVK